jgi:hypothetical protein
MIPAISIDISYLRVRASNKNEEGERELPPALKDSKDDVQ